MSLYRRGLDIMGITKDNMRQSLPNAQIYSHLDTIHTDFPTLNLVGISIVNNTQAEASAAGVGAFNEEPWTRKNRIMDRIHANGMNVLDRCTDAFFEGLYDFPKTNKRNGNRYTYFATPIRDNFSSVLTRNHGFGRTSPAGNLSNYILASQTGNDWTIANGELVGPAGNGWKRAIYFNATLLRDLTMVAKVKKVGNQSLVIRGTQDTNNFPGYGLQMRSGNILRIEDNGRASLGEVSHPWTENAWYWMKFQAIGSAIKGKAWLADDTLYPNSVDGSENEPSAWDIEITNTVYSNSQATYCGFAGESSNGHFKHLNITCVKDTDTWLARYLDRVVANITHYADGDLLTAYPEANDHWPLNNQGSYVQFFSDMQYCIAKIGQDYGKDLLGGMAGHSFTYSLQGQYNALFAQVGAASYDHYGTALGLNKEFGSFFKNSGLTGSQTYTVPTSITESAVHRCDFIPEKVAYNKSIKVYVVNKGTGDWTLTIHGPDGNPVKMYDHTDLSSSSNSYQATIANGDLVNGAYNAFPIDWVNLNTDQTHHFHLTSTVADGTVKTVTASDLNTCSASGYKYNATPEAIEIDIRNMYLKTGVPQFLQEWGDYWSKDSGRSSPVRTQLEHEDYLESMYEAFQRLADDGILIGFNYWRSGFGLEGLYNNAGGPSYTYTLNYAGQKLKAFFDANTDDPPDPVPVAPSGLAAVTASSTTINLTWTDNSDNETGFRIERKLVSGSFAEIGTVAAGVTTFGDTGLTPSTQYIYRVRAYNGSGNSSYSDEAGDTTQSSSPVLLPPSAPTLLAAVAISTSQINLSWTDNANNEFNFRIERKTGAGSFAEVATVNADVTTYSDTGLAAGTLYTYRIRAFNAAGYSSYTNEASATTESIVPPGDPSGLTASVISTTAIDLAWTDNASDELGFKIERRSENGTFTEIATVGANITAYHDVGLSPATRYYYRVRAYKSSINSSYSNEASGLTQAIVWHRKYQRT